MVGAAMGAGVAFATGGNPLMGAVGGGLAGGIAGYNYVPGGAASGSGIVSGPGSSAVPSSAGLGSVDVLTGLDAGFSVDPLTGLNAGQGAAGQGFAASQPGFVSSASSPAQLDIGSALSGATGSESLATTIDPLGGFDPNGFGTGYGEIVTDSPMGAANVTQSQIPRAGVGVSALRPEPLLQQRITAGLSNLGDNLSGFVKDLPGKITGSEPLRAGASKVLSDAVSSGFVGDRPDMSAEERANMAALEQARAYQKGQMEKKQAVSDSYVQQAASMNPEYYGQQALTAEQNRLARSQQAGLRDINPSNTGLLSAQQRRNALDKSRLGGYDRGRQDAETKRLAYMQAAQASSPDGSGYAGNIAGDLKAADSRYKRLEAAGQEAANVFEPIFDDIFSKKKKEDQQDGVQ
jgi:hypothetical protein